MVRSNRRRLDVDRTALFEALEDEISASILAYATEEARTVPELTDVVDASESTIYRRLDRLVDHGLVEEGTEIDLTGNHRRSYRTAIRRVEIELADGGIDLRVERREDEVDRFTRIWEDIRGEN